LSGENFIVLIKLCKNTLIALEGTSGTGTGEGVGGGAGVGGGEGVGGGTGVGGGEGVGGGTGVFLLLNRKKTKIIIIKITVPIIILFIIYTILLFYFNLFQKKIK
jgi:hypothetical protein